jgi:hypothetical protein
MISNLKPTELLLFLFFNLRKKQYDVENKNKVTYTKKILMITYNSAPVQTILDLI